MATIVVRDAQHLSSREKTPEGMLVAPATITRAGSVQYRADDIGLPGGDRMVTVERTLDTIQHPETLSSASRATLTLGHPADRSVAPKNYGALATGHVFGSPTVTPEGALDVKVLVGDAKAIDFLENQSDEVSVGYSSKVVQVEPDLYRTDGPMVINHVALCRTGRAGPTVRVHDSIDDPRDPRLTAAGDRDIRSPEGSRDLFDGDDEMDEQKFAEVLKAALADALPKHFQANATDANDAGAVDRVAVALTATLTDALKPVMATVDAMKTAQDEATARAEAETARVKAEDAAKAFEADIVKRESRRYATLDKARHIVGAEVADSLRELPTKDILAKALDGKVSDIANRTEDYLAAALDFHADAAKASGSSIPAGVGAANRVDLSGAGDSSDARAEYIKTQAEAWKKPLNG